MIDQFVIGFKPQRWWGTLAAVDFFLGGTGAGTFILSMYFGFTAGMIIGWIAVALGAVALLIDLGRPGRFMRAGSQVARSWISRGVLFTTVFLVFGILRLVAAFADGLSWGNGTALGQVIAVIATLGALGVMFYTGFLLSQSPSIPFWNTTMLPLLFALNAFTCGMGVIMLLMPVLAGVRIDNNAIEVVSIGLLVASLVFLWIYMLSMSSSTVAAKESVRILTSGPVAPAFWTGVNAIGLVIPLIIAVIAYLSNSPAVLSVAGVLTLVGGFLFRQSMLKAGVYPPVLDI